MSGNVLSPERAGPVLPHQSFSVPAPASQLLPPSSHPKLQGLALLSHWSPAFWDPPPYLTLLNPLRKEKGSVFQLGLQEQCQRQVSAKPGCEWDPLSTAREEVEGCCRQRARGVNTDQSDQNTGLQKGRSVRQIACGIWGES